MVQEKANLCNFKDFFNQEYYGLYEEAIRDEEVFAGRWQALLRWRYCFTCFMRWVEISRGFEGRFWVFPSDAMFICEGLCSIVCNSEVCPLRAQYLCDRSTYLLFGFVGWMAFKFCFVLWIYNVNCRQSAYKNNLINITTIGVTNRKYLLSSSINLYLCKSFF